MACTLTSGTTVITLPDDISWTDEYGYSSIGETKETSSTGAALIELSQELTGRPITLSSGGSGDYYAVITRATSELIRAVVEAIPTGPMTLLLIDGRTFTVRFRYSDSPPYDAKPFKPIAPVADADFYTIVLKLKVVTA